MKGLFILLVSAFTLLGSFAHAEFPVDTKSQALLGLANNRDPLPGIGLIIHRTKNAIKCTYNFAVSGGAISTIPLNDDQGNPCTLPLNAIVTNVVAYSSTAVTSAGSATISLGSNISGSTTDLMSATGKATLSQGAFTAGNPVGTAATWVGPVTTQAGSQVQVAIAAAAVTAGVVEFFIEYHIF
jgi:hypothetical protein